VPGYRGEAETGEQFFPRIAVDSSCWLVPRHLLPRFSDPSAFGTHTAERLTAAPFVAKLDDRMVNELRAVVEELGGEETLGRPLSSDRDMCDAIRNGFPPSVVRQLMRSSGLTLKELAGALDLSPRSLQRRRRTGRLARYESDRLYRLARIVALASKYLGDHDRALRWLKRPNRALGGVAPVSAVDTELGARQVENVLGRIAYGGVS
jgi:putative toxin-antitoxin system antitoxin component (TIGR02293 family)